MKEEWSWVREEGSGRRECPRFCIFSLSYCIFNCHEIKFQSQLCFIYHYLSLVRDLPILRAAGWTPGSLPGLFTIASLLPLVTNSQNFLISPVPSPSLQSSHYLDPKTLMLLTGEPSTFTVTADTDLHTQTVVMHSSLQLLQPHAHIPLWPTAWLRVLTFSPPIHRYTCKKIPSLWKIFSNEPLGRVMSQSLRCLGELLLLTFVVGYPWSTWSRGSPGTERCVWGHIFDQGLTCPGSSEFLCVNVPLITQPMWLNVRKRSFFPV